jgi:predicted nucleic acid-binding Zn ribbon protein
MSRVCLECGESISGRSDKKFCTDSCRNAFNNRLNSNETNYVRNVNNTLRKNRRILQDLLPTEETSRCSRSKLVELGFDFHFFTSTYTNRKGETYFYCYEFGYLPLENEYFCLVRKRVLA